MHRLVAALATVALVVVAACSDGDDPEGRAVATTSTSAPQTAPLTGLRDFEEDYAKRPAIVVKVDSTKKGLEIQEGVSKADVVYNERVEGGATRLAAVFHSTHAESIGPVRSARTTDVHLTANLNRPLFSFSGANGGVLRLLRSANLIDVGYDAATNAYQEKRGVPSVLRLFASSGSLYSRAPDAFGPPNPLFTYRGRGEPAPAGEKVEGVRVAYGGNVDTEVTYRYDRGRRGWLRAQHGEPHRDGEEQIAPTNVIVQFTEYRASGFRDVTGAESPEAVLVGEGEAWVLTSGRLVRGRWVRPAPEATTQLVDQAGAAINLAPGRTWVELVPPGGATTLTPAP